MGIKNKSRDPSVNEFSPKEIVINTTGGTLFYKSNNKLYKVRGDEITTAFDESTQDDDGYNHTQLYPFWFYEESFQNGVYLPFTGLNNEGDNQYGDWSPHSLATPYDGAITDLHFVFEGHQHTWGAYYDEMIGYNVNTALPDNADIYFSPTFKFYKNIPLTVENDGLSAGATITQPPDSMVFNDYHSQDTTYGNVKVPKHNKSQLTLIHEETISNLRFRTGYSIKFNPPIEFEKHNQIICFMNHSGSYSVPNQNSYFYNKGNFYGHTLVKYKIQ